MKTAKSRAEVNNHDNSTEHCQCSSSRSVEPETEIAQNDTMLDSDDDDYFVNDELNFHVDGAIHAKK